MRCCRLRGHCGTGQFIPILATTLILIFGHCLRADTKEYSYIWDADKGTLLDYQFIKSVTDKLGNAYQNLQVLVSGCNTGGFAEEATGKLQGAWSVTASREKGVILNEKERTTTTFMSKPGLEIDLRYYYGFTAAWTRGVKAADSTAEQLKDFAKTNDFQDADPVFTQANDGKLAKLSGGAKGRHAIIWSAVDHKDWYQPDAEISEVYRAVKARNYSDTTIDFAHMKYENQIVGGEKVDRKATKANLDAMLSDMRMALNADPQQRKAFIMLYAHGNTEEKDASAEPGALPGELHRGIKLANGSDVPLQLNPSFVSRFFEEIGPIDNPDWQRDGQPFFRLSTSEETIAGPVTVKLDGQTLGTILLSGSLGGGDYELPLSDATLLGLYNSGALNDGVADLSFQFSGGSNDYFRLATEADFDAGIVPDFGVGLAAPAANFDEVPEPLSGIAVSCLALLLACKRSRQSAG